MADVGEKRRLCPVNLRQGLGTLALLLVSACVGNGGGYASGEQIVERAIAFIQLQARTDTGHQDADWLLATWRNDRKRHGLLDRFRIRATRKMAESSLQIVYMSGLASVHHFD